MSMTTYNLIHLFGLAAVLVSLGGTAALIATGQDIKETVLRLPLMALHGIGLVALIVAGFGMLARLSIGHGGAFPGWVWMKIVLWIIFGIMPFWMRRSPRVAKPLLWVIPLLVFSAGYLALFKP